MASQYPDLIIGIDVGMSCTGVAYSNLRKSGLLASSIRVLNRWEHRATEDKVPTVVVYDKNNLERGPTTWGFGSESEIARSPDRAFGHWFKQRFCPSPSSRIQGHTIYEDFLSKLYGHIKKEFPDRALYNASWDTAAIEFLFSVPATWDSLTAEKFKLIAMKAGFASRPRHRVITTLTEPQAVATFAISGEKGIFKDNDQMLIVDAGGGTVDLCLVQVNNKDSKRILLSEIRPVSGEDAGSTYIDVAFEDLAKQQLEKVDPQRLGRHTPASLAWELMMSRDFQNCKLRLGKDTYAEDVVFPVKVPSLTSGDSIESCNIENGEMQFEWGQLMRMFDEQIEEIAKNIDEVLDRLDHIILSGGLGASEYVQKQLEARYNQQSARKILRDVTLHPSSLPQLCVCKGLLYERIHNLQYGSSSFTKLCSQFSFGIVKMQDFDRFNSSHKQADKEGRGKTIENKKLIEYVQWFIHKGSPRLPSEVVTRPSYVTFSSDVPKSDFVGQICIVSSILEDPPEHLTSDKKVQSKPKHWYSSKKGYQRVDFDICATLGAAEVKFECRAPSNGKKLSVDSVIQVPVISQRMDAPQAVLY
ncbi:hypothetical protein M426DRAFT_257606 [Hypoxylon sp. CI-4A]|nr:hypothetical protein M426DRAFT_257606 [Hypoxylon sp. CI-4A]